MILNDFMPYYKKYNLIIPKTKYNAIMDYFTTGKKLPTDEILRRATRFLNSLLKYSDFCR